MKRNILSKRLWYLTITAATLITTPAAAGWWCDNFDWASSWCPKHTVDCGPLTAVSDFGSNPGHLEMCTYIPSGLPAGRPLVVALHGCDQQAKDYGAPPGWTKLADEYRFALLLPQQTTFENPLRCFNWFTANDVKRHDAGGTTGEAASIYAMIQKMQAEYKTDPKNVYVTGLSAGGAMTAVMLAAYPELFKGGAPVAGVPYGCAQDSLSAPACMIPGEDMRPVEWGNRVRAAASGHVAGDAVPKISIWQGLEDQVVNPRNADEMVDEWVNVVGIDDGPDKIDTVNGANYKGYADSNGTIVVEEYLIPNMDHGVAIDPKNGCGTEIPYVLDKKICSSRLIVIFGG